MTYQQAACDHHVAEVLAGHQGEGALLLELPEHQDQLRDGSCCVGIWDKRLKRMQPELLLSNKRKIVMNRNHLNIMATLLCSAVATKRRMVASKNCERVFITVTKSFIVLFKGFINIIIIIIISII